MIHSSRVEPALAELAGSLPHQAAPKISRVLISLVTHGRRRYKQKSCIFLPAGEAQP